LTDKRFKWKEYFENIPILAFKSSLDGKILDCNNQVLRKLGYKSKKELVGKPLINIIYAPSSREKAEKLFSMWKKTGKIRNEELQVITKHGELLFVLLNADTIRKVSLYTVFPPK
jgi:PAS domain S-box-containing protein